MNSLWEEIRDTILYSAENIDFSCTEWCRRMTDPDWYFNTFWAEISIGWIHMQEEAGKWPQ